MTRVQRLPVDLLMTIPVMLLSQGTGRYALLSQVIVSSMEECTSSTTTLTRSVIHSLCSAAVAETLVVLLVTICSTRSLRAVDPLLDQYFITSTQDLPLFQCV